jgi:6-phosphogluconate dehydrogenase
MASDIGIIGLGVMGKSLARNFASKNIKVSVYNAPLPGEEKVTQQFVGTFPEADFYSAQSLNELVDSLQAPRMILLMIKSGEPVDEMLEKLAPLLQQGDIVIDGGNSFFKDTQRRATHLGKKGIHFVGMGVSGGEEGALLGPSLMPAGSLQAKTILLPLLEKVAAKAGAEPCVNWIGEGGAGHFVKMVHNGIEYADMQLLSEVYDICRKVLGLSNIAIADLFEQWNADLLQSYLIEITIDILRKKEKDVFVLDTILDVAGHKGTGMWTSREAIELGVAVPAITAALNQRIISSYKVERENLSRNKTTNSSPLVLENVEELLQKSLLCARLLVMAEGFHLMQIASQQYDWNMELSAIARVWRNGCIIRSALLPTVANAFATPSTHHLLQDASISKQVSGAMPSMNKLLAALQQHDIPLPCLTATNQYYKSFTSNHLPINLIQAQRDYFGAHTYRTVDNPTIPRHTSWKQQ